MRLEQTRMGVSVSVSPIPTSESPLDDIRECVRDVRFTLNSGHAHQCPLSANSGPVKARRIALLLNGNDVSPF